PREARTLTVARRSKPGQQSGAKRWIGCYPLVDAYLGPLECGIEALVRGGNAGGLPRQRAIVRHVPFVQSLGRAKQFVVRGLRVIAPGDTTGDDNGNEMSLQLLSVALQYKPDRNVARFLLIRHQ